ncbi:MAG: pyridoxal-phosphate dependent enzyme [Candidatus Aminicenantes bacterium]|nr:pyridoxal-phosphate dependent enzyme [Candidatus Aminicenantes bacterium]
MTQPTIDDVRRAAERIRPYAHRTPVLTCNALDKRLNASLFLKCENFQKVGAFKFRGAVNAVFSLSDRDAARGVATHSSGNHAQALTLAARMHGVPAVIVMPSNAPAVKKAAVAGYGARIVYCEPTNEAREAALAEVVKETGAAFVHPSNDPLVIAGQGTAAMELLEEIPGLDVVMAPIGGGGLMSGTAVAVSALAPKTRIVAAEPKAADDAYRSIQAGRILPSLSPKTIADGLLTSLGDNTYPIIRDLVERIVTVSEAAIIEAMRFVWERAKIVIEPSSAVPLAALWEKGFEAPGARIGVIISGGNVDLNRLPWQ